MDNELKLEQKVKPDNLFCRKTTESLKKQNRPKAVLENLMSKVKLSLTKSKRYLFSHVRTRKNQAKLTKTTFIVSFRRIEEHKKENHQLVWEVYK